MPCVKSNLGWATLAFALQAQVAVAQGDLLGADEMAEAIVSMTSPVWTGPRVALPRLTNRPTRVGTPLRSARSLVAVHVDPEVSLDKELRALRALEDVRASLDARGWPNPISDGDLGGGPELDLYLTGELREGAYTDGLVPWTYLDRATAFAVLSPATPDALLEACVAEAYANALLLSADPAEAEGWRRATAAWLAWELTGRFGCDDAVYDQQAEPFRSWIAGAAGRGAGGALFLAYLSARHDAGSDRFVRDVWTLATQRTWEGEGLRADPDLWSATEAAIERSGDRLLDNVEELAVLRWFIGRAPSSGWSLDAVDGDAKVPVARKMTRAPTKVTPENPLQSFGSAYVTMERAAWDEASALRVWLRGEYGTRWSLIAVQLDARGGEVSRLAAPRTETTPRAYLPIELEPATTRLLFVVTNLSHGLPDADRPISTERAFELIADRAD